MEVTVSTGLMCSVVGGSVSVGASVAASVSALLSGACVSAVLELETKLEAFTKNEKNMTNYATPFGNLVVGIDTQRIALEMSEQKMGIKVDYALDINYEFLADCKISIEVSALPS